MNTKLFGQFRYPTVPLHVSDEYRNRLLREAFTKRGIAVGEDQQ